MKPGVLAGILSCCMAVLGIFTIGTIFVPLAAICAIFGTISALSNFALSGIGVNVLPWVLTIRRGC